jgi:hypothetical protein
MKLIAYCDKIKKIFNESRRKVIIAEILFKNKYEKPLSVLLWFTFSGYFFIVLGYGLIQYLKPNIIINIISLFVLILINILFVILSDKIINKYIKIYLKQSYQKDISKNHTYDLSYAIFYYKLERSLKINIKKINLAISFFELENIDKKLPNLKKYIFLFTGVLLPIIINSIQDDIVKNPYLSIPIILIGLICIIFIEFFEMILNKGIDFNTELIKKLKRTKMIEEFEKLK